MICQMGAPLGIQHERPWRLIKVVPIEMFDRCNFLYRITVHKDWVPVEPFLPVQFIILLYSKINRYDTNFVKKHETVFVFHCIPQTLRYHR